MRENKPLRVCVIGAGRRFLSGISYYTLHLVNALALPYSVSTILMRRLLPAALYPGRKRVGAKLTQLHYDPAVHVFDGVDWYWLPSIIRSLIFLVRERPNVVVFQWWSGTVLHSYLLLAIAARLLRARIVIEFHEILDTGEAKIPLVRAYVRLLIPLLTRLTHGFVVHSDYDRDLLRKYYPIDQRPIALIPHGPYHYSQLADEAPAYRDTPASCCNLLFFGVIRPFKGVEDLISAFNSLSSAEVAHYWLTIVGETWEGWTIPAELIARSPYRNRITFVNRYVSDQEAAQFFAAADAVVLPYHRSSMSGPLHMAMSCGLPVIVTHVGGLIEAVTDYEGALLVPPTDVIALKQALRSITKLTGRRYDNPHSWNRTVTGYQKLFKQLNVFPHTVAGEEETIQQPEKSQSLTTHSGV